MGTELLSYQRERQSFARWASLWLPEATMFGLEPAIGCTCTKDNRCRSLSLQQLDGIFGAQRSAAWRRLTWISRSPGAGKEHPHWGQLGLTGEWAEQANTSLRLQPAVHFPQEIGIEGVLADVSGSGTITWSNTTTLLQPTAVFQARRAADAWRIWPRISMGSPTAPEPMPG